MKHFLAIICLFWFAHSSEAQSDSSQFAIIHFSDADLNVGVIHLTGNDGKLENLAQLLKIENPLKEYRNSPAKMEIRLLQFMDLKGYDLVSYNSYNYSTSTSKWIFRKRKQFKVY